MGNIKKSGTNVIALVISLVVLGVVAVWQFYLFAKFRGLQGVGDPQGGTHHFWWGLVAALLACAIGIYLWSVSLRYDKDSELHITS